MSRYMTMENTLNSSKMLRDADALSNGASNPIAVAMVLSEMLVALSRSGVDTKTICNNPAIRVTLDHLCVIVFGSNHPEGTESYMELIGRLNLI